MAKTKKYKNYEDIGNGALPELDAHSIKKHNILRDYIYKYVLKLMSNARRPELELTLVDAFCGAGQYQPDYHLANATFTVDKVLEGSPVIMLRAIEEARHALNIGRKTPRRVRSNFIFADCNSNAIDSLHCVIKHYQESNPSFTHSDNQINIKQCKFEKLLPEILTKFQTTPNKRVIFFLDQFAYKNVSISSLYEIFSRLPNAEVIMTFNIGSLLTYIADHPTNKKALENIGLGKNIPWGKIAEIKTDEQHWKHVLQSYIAQEIHEVSGARYITPFFINPLADQNKNTWEYWLVHLSNHHIAHDVMKQIHWEYENFASHELAPGIFMSGYDANSDPEVTENSFLFTPENKTTSNEKIAEYLAAQVHSQDCGIAVGSLILEALPKSTGTILHMNESLALLAAHKEIMVINENGNIRRPVKLYKETDMVVTHRQSKIIY